MPDPSTSLVGRPIDRGANRRVQGGLLPLRQGRRRHHHHQGARHRDALPRAKPDGGRAGRHDQRSRRRRQRHDRLPRVPDDDGPENEGHRLRGGNPRSLQGLRQGRQRLHLRRRAPPHHDQPRRKAHRRRSRRDAPRSRHRRRRPNQLRGVRQDDDVQVTPSSDSSALSAKPGRPASSATKRRPPPAVQSPPSKSQEKSLSNKEKKRSPFFPPPLPSSRRPGKVKNIFSMRKYMITFCHNNAACFIYLYRLLLIRQQAKRGACLVSPLLQRSTSSPSLKRE
mmetsp:Transcript_2177/g.7335  ORF Transcript_2177/g.7335 Transcript_2177/m.7335 type:complete len:281 (-) Transcript_2177:46-888(-)